MPVGVTAVLVEAGWLFADGPSAPLVSDLAAMVVAALAAMCCLDAARHHPAGLRRFWRLFAVTMTLTALGRLMWTVGRIADDTILPNNLVIGVVFTAGIITGTGALLSCLTAPTTAVARTRTVLDGVIVGLALVPVGWIVALRDVTAAPLTDPIRIFGLLYPMLDLVQLTVLVAVSGPARPMWRALALIGGGLTLRVAADTLYVSLVARGTYYAGHPIDLCWPASYLLLLVATRYPPPPRRATAEEGQERPMVPWWRLTLPYLPVGGAIVGLMAARHPSGGTPGLIFFTGMALLAALAVRQGLAAYENSRLAFRLRRLAYTDQLTGLANRLLFNKRLERAINARQRVAVLLLDLDGFKQVNDRFGHATGDELLTTVGHRMRSAVGARGLLARLGGDEFAVLVDRDRAGPPEHLAVQLLGALHSTTDAEQVGVHASASIGIAEYGPQHAGHADVLRDADIAMYAAKAAGKSAYRICTPALREAAVTRAEMIADLRRAVDEGGQFALEYQPIVDLDGGRVLGAEALVRWRHPRRGVLSPALFLPLAEETGLILAIDRWVVREACRAAASWQDVAPGTTVAVNIAPTHLRRANLPDTIAEATGAAGLPPRVLTLELTETALIDGTDAVLDRLHHLRDLGVKLAIDDFGTGYSSLSYLHRIPATELKIDRSFVARLDGGDRQAYATVDMVSKLAAAFDLTVVAEGVETDSQHQAVTRIGCPWGQGYRYGRPGTLAALRERFAVNAN